MDKKEIRTLLTESAFNNLCKNGRILHNSVLSGKTDIVFTNIDIKEIISGSILEKETDDCILKFALQDIGYDMIREILKRSPIYYELSNTI